MNIGILKSQVQFRNQDVGYYELMIQIDDEELRLSGDKRGLVLKEIAINLREQSFLTGLPIDQWLFTFQPEIAQKMGFSTPELRFDGSKQK